MKKIFLLLLLFSASTLLAEELFTINNGNTIVATKDSANTIGLLLNQTIHQEILEKEVVDFSMQLPFINGLIDIELQKFSCFSKDFRCISKTENGDVELDVFPTLLSYRMKYNNEVIGIMNFVNEIDMRIINSNFFVIRFWKIKWYSKFSIKH